MLPQASPARTWLLVRLRTFHLFPATAHQLTQSLSAGITSENVAAQYGVSRETQDKFAARRCAGSATLQRVLLGQAEVQSRRNSLPPCRVVTTDAVNT